MSPPAVDLAPMHQELARADFLVAELSGRRVGSDMHAVQERFAVFDPRVAVAQVDLVRAQRFDLGAGQRDPALQRLLDKEIVAGLAIVGDQLEAVVGRLGAFLASHPYELTCAAARHKRGRREPFLSIRRGELHPVAQRGLGGAKRDLFPRNFGGREVAHLARLVGKPGALAAGPGEVDDDRRDRILRIGVDAEQALDRDVHPDFLDRLAQRRRLGHLAEVDVAAGKSPVAQARRDRAAQQQHAAGVDHQASGDQLGALEIDIAASRAHFMALAVGQHRAQFHRAAAERAEAHVGGILMLDFVARLHGTIVLVGHARELGGSRRRAATASRKLEREAADQRLADQQDHRREQRPCRHRLPQLMFGARQPDVGGRGIEPPAAARRRGARAACSWAPGAAARR